MRFTGSPANSGHEAAWNAWLDVRLDQRARKRNVSISSKSRLLALREALANQREGARQQLHDDVRQLRTELCQLSTVALELRQVIGL
jgi:hypothetical protein